MVKVIYILKYLSFCVSLKLPKNKKIKAKTLSLQNTQINSKQMNVFCNRKVVDSEYKQLNPATSTKGEATQTNKQ